MVQKPCHLQKHAIWHSVAKPRRRAARPWATHRSWGTCPAGQPPDARDQRVKRWYQILYSNFPNLSILGYASWKWLRPLSSWRIWFPKLSQQTLKYFQWTKRAKHLSVSTKYLVKTPQVCLGFSKFYRHTSFKFHHFHPKFTGWGQHPNIFIHPTPNLPAFLFSVFLCIATAGRLLSVRNHISCPRETCTPEPKKEQAFNLEKLGESNHSKKLLSTRIYLL